VCFVNIEVVSKLCQFLTPMLVYFLNFKGGGLVILYSVTTVVSGWPSRESQKYGGKRTPIICTSLRLAKRIVEENLGDIFETTYKYVVIETVFPNILYSFRQQSKYKQLWYRWEGRYKTGKYVPCEVPIEYARTIGWGIG
jgi:hypothetical protein